MQQTSQPDPADIWSKNSKERVKDIVLVLPWQLKANVEVYFFLQLIAFLVCLIPMKSPLQDLNEASPATWFTTMYENW